ncbi:FRG domain-containing protein [Pantoea agglomerans]|uniref:FRG domain-containing protein n=1 Tax=Enterobacter agglomerans TaxID=549 RepID=UPI003D2CFB64
MMQVGYSKTLTGRFYIEIRDKKDHFFKSSQYASLAALKKAFPRIVDVSSDPGYLKKGEFKGNFFLGFFKSGLVGYTSLFPSVDKAIEFAHHVAKILNTEKAEKTIFQNCIRDDSLLAIRVKSVNDYLNAIDQIPLMPGSVFYFRGHSSYLYKMTPGIYRRPELINNEDVIYNELLIRCPDDFSHAHTTFESLVKMQHYSLPTRLLDLTANPLVALYFSCSGFETDKKDGEVKVLSIPKNETKYSDSDTVTILSNLAKQRRNFSTKLLSDETSKDLIRFLDDIKKEKPYFTNRLEEESLKSVVCVKPKLNNARIVRQDGAFLIFGIVDQKINCAEIPQNYYPPIGTKRILIDKNSKEKIMAQLEKIGVSEATIYPEIDKVSTYVSKKYGRPDEVDSEDVSKIISGKSSGVLII